MTDDPASFRIILVDLIGTSRCPRGSRGPRDDILAVDPSTEVDQTATLGAEGKRRQFADCFDLIATRTRRTTSPDHESLFGLGAAGFDDSVLVGVEAAAGEAESPDDFVAPLEDDLSASAAFL